jgi:hypothetical protein
MGLFVLVLGLIFAVSSWYLITPRLLKDIEIPYNDVQHQDFSPNMFVVSSNTPDELLNADSKYNFGRYSNPILRPELHQLNFLQNLFQKKEWHFVAFSDGDLLVGMAVANLGYIETAFIYFCDMKANLHDKVSFVLPGGVGSSHVATSSISGSDCSLFSSSLASFNISMCYSEALKSWKLIGGGILENKNSLFFDIDLRRTGFDEFSMVYPLGPNRAAYTHKTSSLFAQGSLSLSFQSPVSFKQFSGTGLTDFSRTLARSFTEWFWVAFSLNQPSNCDADVCDSSMNGLHGIQLSQGVYRYPPHSPTPSKNPMGDLENIIWIHQRPLYLNSNLIFSVISEDKKTIMSPGQNQLQMGRKVEIRSEDGRIQLTYVPIAQMPTELSTPIFSGCLLHSYGVYSGSIVGLNEERVEFVNVPGIFEDHYAKW